MGLSQHAQFQKILSSSEHLLIVLPENPSGDVIGAGYGLAHFAEDFGIPPTIAFSNSASTRQMHDFLPEPERTTHTLTSTRDFVLTFQTKHNPITDIKTLHHDDHIEIRVTPEKGMVDSRDFSFGLGEFPYSTMVSIGAATKEDLGTLFSEIPDIFYDIPIVNIDRATSNERFGHLDIVTITASSCAEIVADLCEKISPDLVRGDTAQCLLSGIISATDSFRAKATTPRALSLASMLIDRGADQQEIITHLYKSQPFSLITLWGRTLSKMQSHEEGTTVSTLITQKDFTLTNTNTHYLPQIIEKIKENYITAQFFIIIYEAPPEADYTCIALIDAERHGDLPEDVFGQREESGYYETTFTETDCNTGRDKIATLIQNAITKK